MNNLKGPWYSLTEAQQKLEITATELNYLITEEELLPVVFTKARNFLLFYPEQEGWAGLATCQYRGYLTLHRECIAKLLDGDKVELGKGWGKLLEEKGITKWVSAYPFKRALPHPPIVEWLSYDLDEINLSRTAATPLPVEGETIASGINQISNMLKAMTDLSADSNKASTPPAFEKQEANYELFFSKNSIFTPDSLRIPDSEIQRYLTKDDQAQAPQPIATVIPDDVDARENQLHTLILRIIEAKPTISAKGVWRVLEQETQADERIYDTEEILMLIDHLCVEWKSRHGAERTLQFDSLQSLLSKLKKKASQ